MRSLYSVIESILDDDETVVSNSIVNSIRDYGFVFKEGLDDVVSLKDKNLSFFGKKEASGLFFDYNRVKPYLGLFKSIEAPFITINDPPEDCSDLGVLKTRRVEFKDTITCKYKNLVIEPCQDFSGLCWKSDGFSRRLFSKSYNGTKYIANYLSISTFDPVVFTNCKLDVQNISVRADGIEFHNTESTAEQIFVYSPSCFDSDFSKKLFDKLFDSNYSFQSYNDVKGNELQTRKTNSLRKVLAWFNNKHFYYPEETPYKIVGKLNDVIDISKFKSKDLTIIIRDNNTSIEFTRDLQAAQALQRIDSLKYKTNHHRELPPEKTTDGFYVVIFKNK